ncbi:MAG: hypothetical protein U0169_04770 [Polyangiaceae bacterium]
MTAAGDRVELHRIALRNGEDRFEETVTDFGADDPVTGDRQTVSSPVVANLEGRHVAAWYGATAARTTLWLAGLDADGRIGEGPIPIEIFDAVDIQTGNVLAPTGLAIASSDRAVALVSEALGATTARFFGPGLRATGSRFVTGSARPRSVRATWANDAFLVSWTEAAPASTEDAYAVRLDEGGFVRDSGDFVVATDVLPSSTPAFARGDFGLTALAASQTAGGTDALFRLELSGFLGRVRLDSPGILVSDAVTSNLGNGAFAASGTPGSALVAYTRFLDSPAGAPRLVARFVTTRAVASACTSATDCGTRHCADGFCCTSTCDAPCTTCSATPGTCRPVRGEDDTPDCTGTRTCSATAECKVRGGAACRLDTECVTGHCVDGVCCDSACDAPCSTCSSTPGTCTERAAGDPGRSAACAPYVCSGSPRSCASTCASDGECGPNSFCNRQGECKPRVPSGLSCNATLDCREAGCRVCATGFCADGICCDTACDGACDACSIVPGTCTPLPRGNPGFPTCAPAVCDGVATTCPTACTNDAECDDGSRCDRTRAACVPLLANGVACPFDEACSSGSCTDGVCCNARCDGQCEACDVEGAPGVCSPVAGVPSGARPACPTTPGEPCRARACDGIDPRTCAGFVGSDVTCGASSCEGGVERSRSTCDGEGRCSAARTRSCAPFACGAEACKTACAVDGECANGLVCEPGSRTCVKPAECADSTTVRSPVGTLASCMPYLCRAGSCGTSCTSVDDCAAPSVCDGAGKCSPKKDVEAPAEEGCSIAAPGRNGDEHPGMALSLLFGSVVVAARVRRRHAEEDGT